MSPAHADRPSRRNMLRASAGLALAGASRASTSAEQSAVAKGRIKQSVCKWCYPKSSLEELAEAAAAMGLAGIDLLGPDDFRTVQAHGLVCTMTGSHGIADGLNDPKNHAKCLELINRGIEANQKAGFKNVICFSGNRRGMDDKTGLKNCVAALQEITPVAENAGVVINMELLNSRVDHADYMCDKSEWGVELVKQVGSDNFRLLYDIYHMQIMEGDVIRSIQ
ncbi:MAG: TIM barrel protein, partial [Planctomycetota bacterium]